MAYSKPSRAEPGRSGPAGRKQGVRAALLERPCFITCCSLQRSGSTALLHFITAEQQPLNEKSPRRSAGDEPLTSCTDAVMTADVFPAARWSVRRSLHRSAMKLK